MRQPLQVARKEVFTFVLVVIVVAFLVSSLANVVFDRYYEGNELLYIASVSIALTLCAIGSFAVLTASLAKSQTDGLLHFTFDRERTRFLDIPNCPPSVHARVSFGKFSEEKKNYLGSLSTLQSFPNSDLQAFVDDVTQEILINIVVRNAGRNVDRGDMRQVSVQDLPMSFRSNTPLLKWIRDREIPLPYKAEVKIPDPTKRYFSIDSPYGVGRFRWGNQIGQTAHRSRPYLDAKEGVSSESCCDIATKVSFDVKMKYRRLLHPRMKDFATWASAVSEKLNDLGWQRTQSQLPIVMLHELISKTETDASPLIAKSSENS